MKPKRKNNPVPATGLNRYDFYNVSIWLGSAALIVRFFGINHMEDHE